MTYKAFVSSTYVDLKDHRDRVIEALRKAGIQVDPMEDWTADSDEPKTVSMDRMRDCDLCILLVGARRGHVPENETLSITQMEVREAEKRGIPILAFLYDGESAWPPAFCELDKDEELKKWRADIEEHACKGTFTHDPVSLDNPVRDALNRWIQKQSWPEVLKTYLETLRDAHASIRFLGVGQYKDIQDRPIDSLFVDPNTTDRHTSPDSPPEDWPETTPLFNLVSREKRVVLLGDPGSGKSTLVSWLVWNLARDGENKWKTALGRRIPLVFILRDLSLEKVRSWNDLLSAGLNHWATRILGSPRHRKNIEHLLETGRVMIILDGLDEVGNPKIQEQLREAVWEGMREYVDSTWLLTSRLVGYIGYHDDSTFNEQGLKSPKYAQLRYLSPFADPQIKAFAQNWFTSRDQSALRATDDSDRLIQAIHSNPYTLRLARIPNLLTMMALIHRERARLPHGRALLYTDIATAYLQSIDEHRRIERLGYSLRDQKQWLGRIGFEMQLRRHKNTAENGKDEDKEILVQGQDVREWVVSAMGDAGRTDGNARVPDAFLDEICRRSGLLVPRGEDQYAFTHLSFQEYFAAVFILPQFMLPQRQIKTKGFPGARPGNLNAYTKQRIWHETLVFFVEMMFSEHPDWLEDVLFCLFGEELSDVSLEKIQGKDKSGTKDKGRINQAVLLARLSVDPHSGLIEHNLKTKAIEICCAFEAGEQKRNHERIRESIDSLLSRDIPQVLQALLETGANEKEHICRVFAEALNQVNASAVSLNTCPINDIRPFIGVKELRLFDLAYSNVTDLSLIPKFVNLRKLSLKGTQAKNLSHFAGLTDLESLNLSNTQVSDVGFLSNLSKIYSLQLRFTEVRDIQSLAKHNGLIFLDLGFTKVDDMNALSKHTDLRYLDIDYTPVSDLSALANLKHLRLLNIGDTQVNDISVLENFTGLHVLFMSGVQVRDVEAVTKLANLEYLHVHRTPLSDEDIRELKNKLPQCSISS